MDRPSADEILACLPKDRTPYRYFKDYYALQLLGYAVGNGCSIERIRRSPFGRLLRKPSLRGLLSTCGDGQLSPERITGQWQEPSLPFLLTLGLWGNDSDSAGSQTSRRGFNLVLRLNFTFGHDRHFRELLVPFHRASTLNYRGHPVMRSGERLYFRETLAWSRIDVDLKRGEALIEEIQTDWVRKAGRIRGRLARCGACNRGHTCRQRAAHASGALRYLDEVFAPYGEIWDQAMLSATLQFLRDELGVHCIWYHTWETGNALKSIDPTHAPPLSLYSRLPRQFCFSEARTLPDILKRRECRKRLARARVEPAFHHLQV